MPTYEVRFKFQTSIVIEVEAASQAEAIDEAQIKLDAMEVDRLPEMWPSDFEYEDVSVGR